MRPVCERLPQLHDLERIALRIDQHRDLIGAPPIDTVATSRSTLAPAAFAAATVAAMSDTRKIAWCIGSLATPARFCTRNSGEAPALASATVAPKRMMISVAGLTTRSISFKRNAAS